MMEKHYKYGNAHEWLDMQANTWSHAELLSEFKRLMYKLDGDTIQDEYQSEMDKDGYFDAVNDTSTSENDHNEEEMEGNN